MKHLEYLGYAAYNKFAKKAHLFERTAAATHRYGAKQYIPAQKGNDWLAEMLLRDKPFMAARFGANELAVVRQCEEILLGFRKEVAPHLAEQFCNGAGFFPNQRELIFNFADTMKAAIAEADMCGVWFNPMENYFIKKYNSHMLTSPLTALEPWYHDNPWSCALEGKDVLVIHPFSATIQKQYEKRQTLFSDGLLPDFSLHTLTAVQTIAGNRDSRFGNWFEALDYMFEESMKLDCEVAILGCGAYGFPLAARLKQEGKKVIHLGGATQILFGIKGKRWDDMPSISRFYNESWVRPAEGEAVKNRGSVENGCYW